MNLARVLAVTCAALVLGISAPATATTPETAAGTYQITGRTPLPPRSLPNACFIDMELAIAFGGTFEGVLNLHLTLFSRGPCPGAGTADELHGQGTFQGTVNGVSGTLHVEFRGRHSADGMAEATIVILGGDGDLSTLRGVLWGTGTQGVGGTYEGQIHFEP